MHNRKDKIFLIIFHYHSYIQDKTFKYIDGIFETKEEAEQELLRLINEYENVNVSNTSILVTEKEKLNEFLEKNEKNELLEKNHNNRMVMKFLKKTRRNQKRKGIVRNNIKLERNDRQYGYKFTSNHM